VKRWRRSTGIQMERNKITKKKKIKNYEWKETFQYGRTEEEEKRKKER